MSQPHPEPPTLAPAPIEVDRTPYGQASTFGPGIFLTTCWWVVTASSHRLAHLALWPRSPGSRRFASWMIAWLAVSAAMLQFGHVGWRRATQPISGDRTQAIDPQGRGWYRIAGGGRATMSSGRGEIISVWWNPTQAILASAQAFVATIVAAALLFAWQRRRVRRALPATFRSQGRLEAALHYLTAWLLLAIPAALVASLIPLADVSVAAGWSVTIPRIAIYGVAAVLGIVGFCGYWFGLIRSGANVPAPARARINAFFGVRNPLAILLTAAAIGVGLHFWMPLLSTQLGLAW